MPRDPNYEALRVVTKAVTSSHDGLNIQCAAEFRPNEGVRIMMKVNGPKGKVSQAGSHVFPVGRKSCCSKHAYMYVDMMCMLTMVCEQEKADLAKNEDMACRS